MSKLSASEFQTWESLYWPDHIPREIKVPDSSTEKAISSVSREWKFKLKAYSISWEQFTNVVDSIAKSLAQQNDKPNAFAVLGSDPLAMLVGATVSFKTGVSAEIVSDPSKISSSRAVTINQHSTSGDPESDLKIETLEGSFSPSWEPSEPCVSILFPEDIRAIYPLRELRAAVESFVAFTNLRTESGVAVLGSSRQEFEFFASIATLVSGVPLYFIDDVLEVNQLTQTRVSALFVGRDVIRKPEAADLQSYRRVLRSYRQSFSFIGVEGPAQSEFTKGLEKTIDIPVLQMYGISGRGIILSNTKEFNVHGSQGIPITNVEAIIADNYEGNWTRDRIMMGPGTEGELVVRGEFIDASKDVGDARQNPVKTGILGQSTDWTTTGMIGKMDENGYFYLKDASFR